MANKKFILELDPKLREHISAYAKERGVTLAKVVRESLKKATKFKEEPIV